MIVDTVTYMAIKPSHKACCRMWNHDRPHGHFLGMEYCVSNKDAEEDRILEQIEHENDPVDDRLFFQGYR